MSDSRPASATIAAIRPAPADAGASVAGGRARSRVGRVLGLALVLLAPLLVFGTVGAWLMPHDPSAIAPAEAMLRPGTVGPSGFHLLGTDAVGRDVLSRLIAGARSSLIVALFGVLIAGAFGTLVGMVAGYTRGIVDEVLMRLVDMQLAIPPILLAVLMAAGVGGGLLTVVATLSVTFWPTYARVVRGETLQQMERDHVALARVAGAG